MLLLTWIISPLASAADLSKVQLLNKQLCIKARSNTTKRVKGTLNQKQTTAGNQSEILVLYLCCTFTLYVVLPVLYFRINKYSMRNILYHVKAGLSSRGLCHQTYPTTEMFNAQVWGKIKGEKSPLLGLKVQRVCTIKPTNLLPIVLHCTYIVWHT